LNRPLVYHTQDNLARRAPSRSLEQIGLEGRLDDRGPEGIPLGAGVQPVPDIQVVLRSTIWAKDLACGSVFQNRMLELPTKTMTPLHYSSSQVVMISLLGWMLSWRSGVVPELVNLWGVSGGTMTTLPLVTLSVSVPTTKVTSPSCTIKTPS
jgi:hypothetical protein